MSRVGGLSFSENRFLTETNAGTNLATSEEESQPLLRVDSMSSNRSEPVLLEHLNRRTVAHASIKYSTPRDLRAGAILDYTKHYNQYQTISECTDGTKPIAQFQIPSRKVYLAIREHPDKRGVDLQLYDGPVKGNQSKTNIPFLPIDLFCVNHILNPIISILAKRHVSNIPEYYKNNNEGMAVFKNYAPELLEANEKTEISEFD